MTIGRINLWEIRQAIVDGRMLLEDVLNERTVRQQAMIDQLVKADGLIAKELENRYNSQLRRDIRKLAGR